MYVVAKIKYKKARILKDMKNIKCWECQKEIIAGKYFLIVGKKNKQFFGGVFSEDIFCPPCAESYKKSLVWKEKIKRGDLVVIERELGNQTDDDILEFEEKWKKYKVFAENESTKDVEKRITIAWCQAAQKELKPYLKKMDIVEQAFGESGMNFAYFFNETYKTCETKKTLNQINKIAMEIFGGKPIPEIKEENKNTWGDEKITINNKPLVYQQVGDNYRLINFMRIADQKWALQAYLRALAIKEKELKEEVPNNSPSQAPPTGPSAPSQEKKNSKQPSTSNDKGIIALLVIGGIMACGLIIFLYCRYQREKRSKI